MRGPLPPGPPLPEGKGGDPHPPTPSPKGRGGSRVRRTSSDDSSPLPSGRRGKGVDPDRRSSLQPKPVTDKARRYQITHVRPFVGADVWCGLRRRGGQGSRTRDPTERWYALGSHSFPKLHRSGFCPRSIAPQSKQRGSSRSTFRHCVHKRRLEQGGTVKPASTFAVPTPGRRGDLFGTAPVSGIGDTPPVHAKMRRRQSQYPNYGHKATSPRHRAVLYRRCPCRRSGRDAGFKPVSRVAPISRQSHLLA